MRRCEEGKCVREWQNVRTKHLACEEHHVREGKEAGKAGCLNLDLEWTLGVAIGCDSHRWRTAPTGKG